MKYIVYGSILVWSHIQEYRLMLCVGGCDIAFRLYHILKHKAPVYIFAYRPNYSYNYTYRTTADSETAPLIKQVCYYNCRFNLLNIFYQVDYSYDVPAVSETKMQP